MIYDSFNSKGHDTALGYVSFLTHPAAEKNSALVNILLAYGTILYNNTNVPQTLMVRHDFVLIDLFAVSTRSLIATTC